MEKTEDFNDLTKQSLEKLTKLLDVAKDYRLECFKDYTEADDHVKNIQLEISKRLGENTK